MLFWVLGDDLAGTGWISETLAYLGGGHADYKLQIPEHVKWWVGRNAWASGLEAHICYCDLVRSDVEVNTKTF